MLSSVTDKRDACRLLILI